MENQSEKNNIVTSMTNSEGVQLVKDSTVNEVLKIFKNGWNKQVILYGPPGTSKTYSAKKIAESFLKSNKNDSDWEERCKISEYLKRTFYIVRTIRELYGKPNK